MDLRSQAPTVLVVCAYDSEVATRMQTALSQEAMDKKTRGDGGKGTGTQSRPSNEEFQVKYICVQTEEPFIAGRQGIVK